ncbi:hypothetical protein F5X99DRAFT_409208 [Biscogniauxia marginata]|nr:hypothetical protein F5X99DRAFT_409208 [Biscogniauxia marginata]
MSPIQDQGALSDAGRPHEAHIEDKSSGTAKHRKAKPSIDIKLAQGFKEKERLPIIEKGQDPATEETDATAPAGTEDSVKQDNGETMTLWSREDKEEKKKLKRDLITGRLLSKNGQSCLRCAEKGLRCTLHFYGFDTETRCAACRRSGTEHCVRPLKIQDRVPYSGPPWKDPNFVTGEAKPLPQAQMEKILREHFEGPQSYLQGHYVHAGEQRRMVLPPFNHSGLPWEQRPEGWEKLDWRKILPTHMNRSLTPRSTPSGTPSLTKGGQAKGGPQPDVGEDKLQFLRVSRRYQPRIAHLNEEFPGAW